MKKFLTIIFVFFLLITSKGQDVPIFLSQVYNKIYLSMSNGTIIKPQLKIRDDRVLETSSKEVATYSPINKTITIGLSFIELTRKFGKDSTNARAHVLSHELAHLFLNHGYVSVIGTGFASKELNKEFRKTKETLDERLGEMEADQWASFYAYVSGYQTNRVAPLLLDSIYKYYHLTDELLNKYPPLSERKKYATYASVKMRSMCEAFDFANIATIHGDLGIAQSIYESIIEEGFKSREIISNLAVINLLSALKLMDSIKTRFILPLQIDMNTRMRQNNDRGINDDELVKEHINRAIELLKQAIVIDPDYGIGYLNLSIGYWLINEEADASFYLSKAKTKFQNEQTYKIELFEAIRKISLEDARSKEDGVAILKKLDGQGYSLAKVNLSIIENSGIKNLNKAPDFVAQISSIKLPENFQGSINILDSTFQKDKYRKLSCKEVRGSITYRKWKYLSEPSQIALQYIFYDKENKKVSKEEKNNLILNSERMFESSNYTYFLYGDIVFIVDSDNNIKYQIVKSL